MTTSPLTAPGRSLTGPLLLLTLLFLLLGFALGFNYLVPLYLAQEYSLSPTELGPGQWVFWGASLLLALPAGWGVARLGYARSLAGGLLALAGGGLGLAAAFSGWGLPLAVAGLALLGAGSTLVQVAALAFLAGQGPVRRAAVRLTLVSAAQVLGSTFSPLLGGLLLGGHAAAQQLRGAYLALAGGLLVGAVLLLVAARRPTPQPELVPPATAPTTGLSSPSLLLGLPAALVCAGVPAGLGALFVFFGQSLQLTHLSAFTVARLHEVDGVVNEMLRALGQPATPPTAPCGGFTLVIGATLLGLYGLGGLVGRLAGLLLLPRVPARWVLAAGAAAGAALVAAALSSTALGTTGDAPLWLLVASGLAHALLGPVVAAQALAGLGRHTAPGAGLLVLAATLGTLLTVPVLAWLAAHGGWLVALGMLVVGYLYVLYYALAGRQPPTGEAVGPPAG